MVNIARRPSRLFPKLTQYILGINDEAKQRRAVRHTRLVLEYGHPDYAGYDRKLIEEVEASIIADLKYLRIIER